MSVSRLCVALAIVAVSFAAAATPASGGCGTAKMLFKNKTEVCTKQTACDNTYTSCLGTGPSCTKAIECLSAQFGCIITAAEDTANCPSLNMLHMSVLAVAEGKLWNASAAYTACKYETCKALNTTGADCTLDYLALCQSPVTFVATLVLTGNFAALLNNATLKAKLSAAIKADLQNFLKIADIKILRLFIDGSQRRRQGNDKLITEFSVPVSGQNAQFAARVTSLKSEGNTWLVSAAVVYQEANGPDAAIVYTGVAAGTGASAFGSQGYPSGAASSNQPGSASSAPSGGSQSQPSASGDGGGDGAAAVSTFVVVLATAVMALLF